MCLDERIHHVVQASANTPENMLGTTLGNLMEPEQLQAVEECWLDLAEQNRLLGARLDRVRDQPFYKLILHRYNGLLWVEGEPVADTAVARLAGQTTSYPP